MTVRLAPYRDEDLWLTRALETDPAVMAELGGPRRAAEIPAIHTRRLRSDAPGDRWLTIVPDGAERPVGTIGVWPGEWAGEAIHETGWMVLPSAQGRGIARAALRLLVARARQDGVAALHAFPGVGNAASNALCRGAGFAPREEADAGYAGTTFRVRHWVLALEALRPTPSARSRSSAAPRR